MVRSHGAAISGPLVLPPRIISCRITSRRDMLTQTALPGLLQAATQARNATLARTMRSVARHPSLDKAARLARRANLVAYCCRFGAEKRGGARDYGSSIQSSTASLSGKPGINPAARVIFNNTFATNLPAIGSWAAINPERLLGHRTYKKQRKNCLKGLIARITAEIPARFSRDGVNAIPAAGCVR